MTKITTNKMIKFEKLICTISTLSSFILNQDKEKETQYRQEFLNTFFDGLTSQHDSVCELILLTRHVAQTLNPLSASAAIVIINEMFLKDKLHSYLSPVSEKNSQSPEQYSGDVISLADRKKQ